MNEILQEQCIKFIQARDAIRQSYKIEDQYLVAICANLFVANHMEVDPGKLGYCQDIISQNTGLFSNFRGNARLPQICMLAVSEDPDARFEKALQMYEKLKTEFRGSEYLAFSAMILAELVSVEEADRYITRGRALYQRMKKEHPFLTSSEDIVFAVLLAFSEKSDDRLISDMEQSYQFMKQLFSDGNAVQSVTHVLSFMDAPWNKQCEKVQKLYSMLEAQGRKYSRHFELAVLAAAAILPTECETIVNDMLEIDRFLSEQKGYGGLFGIDKKTRLMHAAMLAIDGCSMVGEYAAITGTLSMIAAQQAAMCCMISANVAASAAASHA